MKIIKLVIPMLIGITFSANAQRNQNLISLSAGSSILAKQDLIYSPFVHSDRSLVNYGMGFQRDKKYFQYFNSGFTVNKAQVGELVEMDMEDHSHMIHPHEFLNITATYGFGKSLKETPVYKEWIGGAAKVDLQASFYNFALSNMFGYFINQSANIWYRRSYNIGKHSLTGHVELPLVSWMSRPPYLAEDDEFVENISSHNSYRILLSFVEDGKFATWNKLQKVNLNIEYMYPISKRFNIGAIYNFDFIHTRQPRSYISYQHKFNLATSYKF
jgi:hypothetical protein